jgi:hypothetical protein
VCVCLPDYHASAYNSLLESFLVFLVSDTHRSSTHLWQEDGIDLVTIIKAAGFYRRGKNMDHVSDYMPPTPTEFQKVNDEYK